MANLLLNSFSAYDLSDEEVIQGSIFNELQKQVLQNHLASYAQEKIALDYDPDKEKQFLQDEASIKGKIDLLVFLIESSDSSEELLLSRIKSED